MKKSLTLAALFAAMLALVFTGCKPEEKPGTETSTLEAFVKTIKIVNGGISGGDMINGEVDNTAMTLTFNNVPAETNIAGVKFQATTSLGAYIENDTYDFTAGNPADAKTLTATLKCINKTDKASKEETYQLILNLSEPASAPVIEKIVMKDDKGAEVTLTSANVLDGLLCLGMPESSTATVVSVTLSPLRATYEFTTANAGVIAASNPGYFKMDFMGLSSEFEVTFASSPTPGADWSQAVVHDFSIKTSNVYPDLAEEFTRGGDFDGEYVLLANRTAPKLFAVRDLLNDNTANPILLSTTGIEGGTHVVSAGRLSHGHIYLCNLATAINDVEGGAGPLKVYHYATPTSEPEVVLTWDGTGVTNSENDYTARLGDNISIHLDDAGNGYAFFFKQEADNKYYRFTVSGFTTFSDPVELELPAVCNYYGMMNFVENDTYIFTSSYVPMMWLFGPDGTMKQEFEWAKTVDDVDVTHACDPRVIEFNRSRYLMLSNARRFLYWAEEGVHVFDISDGNDIVSALVKFFDQFDEEAQKPAYAPCYQYIMPGEVISSACVALCNAAEVDGKLVIWAAAPHAGMVLIEVPKMK
ncbi:MAG: DUF4623 domain-containing protein [Paludibacteraceae bacterium]|nr:DUF4623 domain-containing protein [Paludibacteraceae bacterium]